MTILIMVEPLLAVDYRNFFNFNVSTDTKLRDGYNSKKSNLSSTVNMNEFERTVEADKKNENEILKNKIYKAKNDVNNFDIEDISVKSIDKKNMKEFMQDDKYDEYAAKIQEIDERDYSQDLRETDNIKEIKTKYNKEDFEKKSNGYVQEFKYTQDYKGLYEKNGYKNQYDNWKTTIKPLKEVKNVLDVKPLGPSIKITLGGFRKTPNPEKPTPKADGVAEKSDVKVTLPRAVPVGVPQGLNGLAAGGGWSLRDLFTKKEDKTPRLIREYGSDMSPAIRDYVFKNQPKEYNDITWKQLENYGVKKEEMKYFFKKAGEKQMEKNYKNIEELEKKEVFYTKARRGAKIVLVGCLATEAVLCPAVALGYGGTSVTAASTYVYTTGGTTMYVLKDKILQAVNRGGNGQLVQINPVISNEGAVMKDVGTQYINVAINKGATKVVTEGTSKVLQFEKMNGTSKWNNATNSYNKGKEVINKVLESTKEIFKFENNGNLQNLRIAN